MDKEEGRYCAIGDRSGCHEFHPWWLRSYWELESVGQQTLLPSAERELPGVLYSSGWHSAMSISPQHHVQHWCNICRETRNFEQRGLLYCGGCLQLPLHCHVKHYHRSYSWYVVYGHNYRNNKW